jgi:hypothetical protein
MRHRTQRRANADHAATRTVWSVVAAISICLSLSLTMAQAAATAEPVRSRQSGDWSDPATWENDRAPAAGDNVLVRAGHTIVYDVVSNQAIRVLKIAGALRFATDRDTRLDVGLIRVEAGDDVSEEGFECDGHIEPPAEDAPRPTLEIGSAATPVDAAHTALIRLVYFEGMNKDSCPAIVNCGGRMDFHGAAMNRTWVKLGAKANEDSTEIELAEPVEGWRAGHRILIPTTDSLSLFERGDNRRSVIPTVRKNSHSEERTIVAIDGKKLSLDAPLFRRHRAEGNFRGEVANLSRNVIVESADPAGVRGHTMYHTGSSGAISYAEFRHLGKQGVLGRYSLHFHLCRDTMRGSYVIGASIHDSDNRWLTIHGTDYLVVRDCVGYNSIGHGFFLEDGTEVFNVFDRNLAVQARHGAPLPKQVLPFDENEGAGFWWSNSLNTFTRNVAAECDQYGFRFEATKTAEFDPVLDVPGPDGKSRKVDIRTLPFVRFDNNEAHSHRRFAFNLGGIRHVSDAEDHRAIHTPGADRSRILGGHVDGVGPDTQHPFIIRNFRVWNSQWVFHGGSPCVLIDGLEATDCAYGIFKTRMDAHEYRNLNMTRIDTAAIFEPWGSSSVEENYDRYLDTTHDDLPPTTVITHLQPLNGSRLSVRGTTADNGRIKKVTVNGQPAKSVREGFAEWQVVLEAISNAETVELSASAEDTAGNVEPRPHRLSIAVPYRAKVPVERVSQTK